MSKLSITMKMGIIAGLVLLTSLSAMVGLILYDLESEIKENEKTRLKEMALTITRSVEFAMGGGIPDIQPFITSTKDLPRLLDLRIIPTDFIRKGSEDKMEPVAKEVSQLKKQYFSEEAFRNEPIIHVVTNIPASEACTSCHEAPVGTTLATVSIRYSMKQIEADLTANRLYAIGMAILAILLTIGMILYFMRKKVFLDLKNIVQRIITLSHGELTEKVEHNRNDEIGDLMNAYNDLSEGLKNHTTTAIEISEGSFTRKISLLSKDDALGKSLQLVRSNLLKLTADINDLNNSAIAGDLKKRIDGSSHAGEYKKIVLGINDMMESALHPIEEGKNALAVLAKGDFTQEFNGDYRGDHKQFQDSINFFRISISELISKIHDSVNTTANAVDHISESAENIAAGSQEQAMHTGEIASAIEEMTKTIFETSKSTSFAAQLANSS
ncbi:MAG: methyl-accepting chemotaxis protein, partial [Ignavibacteriales bacterium]|nr:methyl-accepting chemotaxis protein [Ignavibacteriales bacterium]